MKLHRRSRLSSRRGATLVLFAVLLVVLIGMIAMAVDIGYVTLVRAQLQSAADSSAMAATSVLSKDSATIQQVAQHYAAGHKVGGQSVSLSASDVEVGLWDIGTKTFTVSPTGGNAVRVTAHRDNANFFFGRIFGQTAFSTTASAIGMAKPRDIVFLVDLSGSMNDDSEPCWATNEITNEFTPLGYSTVGTDLMQQVFTDFNYGTFPGTLQWIGSPASVAANSSAYANLTVNSGPLTLGSVNATYKIASGDSEATRKTKAYKWIIDKQIAVVMPNAKPTPSSSTSLNYWTAYLDYLIEPKAVTGRGTLPPNQASNRIDGWNNPNGDSYPSASSSVPQGYRNQIGYRTYVQFMIDHGRNVQPDGATYTPLSTLSADCPYHTESTAGGSFSFPPREQPTHAARRSLIAAIQVVKERNQGIADTSQRDWVSIVTFDTKTPGPVVQQTLTGVYETAMQACTTMQAVGDNQQSTATETGLIAALNHIKSTANGGFGRANAQKVVVMLTDGMPNLYSSSNSTISTYATNNSSSDWYGNSNVKDAALMQSITMQLMGWAVYPVGLGLGTDYDFMDRMARTGGTSDDDGQSPRGSGNPAQYEQRLVEIFEDIITNPKSRLVQ